MTTRILLAEDQRMMREGLRALLDPVPGVAVVAEAENGRCAVKLCRDLRPDVVIMDVSMPDLNGIEATRQIMATQPEIRVIALSIHSDRRFVIEMFRAGACGYLLKDCAFEELFRAIEVVSHGQPYLSPGIAGVAVDEFRLTAAAGAPAPAPALTTREREVLQLTAEGKSTKEIAALLQVSVKTIETHLRQIMDKLQLNSIAELTRYAIREGLTSL